MNHHLLQRSLGYGSCPMNTSTQETPVPCGELWVAFFVVMRDADLGLLAANGNLGTMMS